MDEDREIMEDNGGGFCGCLLVIILLCITILAVAITWRLVEKILTGNSFVG